ncbi:Arm DNA-binding domain-containing protein [Xanthobacter aminoxidans]|uniref:Arm DNA-binding domain-containing protein n=1 Tax=Xanthobacter aminoxidans TaxID=186280 RepID=UPI0032670B6B
MALSDAVVRSAKPQPRPVKPSGGGDLHLLATPAGGRLWRLAYRFDGGWGSPSTRSTSGGSGTATASLSDTRRRRTASAAWISRQLNSRARHR